MSDESLVQLVELNSLILNSVADGVYGISKDGCTTFCNPASERLTGWSRADLLGNNSHNIWHHTHVDGSHYPASECPIFAVLQDGVIHKEQNEVFWRKDGSSFPVEYISSPMFQNGKIVGAVVVFKDITQRRKQEHDLQLAHEKVQQLQKQLQAENKYLQEEINCNYPHNDIVGKHPSFVKVMDESLQVAPTEASVLIHGETGTGKELIARLIHQNSNRRDKPLIKINCGAISENLVESELFGHEKGAFTGAIQERKGRFELANGGTLFLDEVAELPLNTQTKLLRVLQEQEFERVGGSKTIKVNVRIISASHKNLEELCQRGHFRQDLFYRLNVFPLFVPALRERKSDIPLLTESILVQLAKKLGKPIHGVCSISTKQMNNYPWIGNIRELQNVLERAAILSNKPILVLPELTLTSSDTRIEKEALPILNNSDLSLSNIEKSHILQVLEISNWKISGRGGAAETLKIHSNTLRSRMEKLGIKR